jgi:integrase
MARPTTAPGHGRVRLQKRGRYYYARFTDGGERREVALRVANKIPAEEKAKQINDALEAGNPWEWVIGRQPAGAHTFAEVMAEFLEKDTRWSQSTLNSTKSSRSRLLAEFGQLPVGDVDARVIEAYLARRRDEGRSKGTRNRELAILKAVLKKAHEWAYVPRNAAAEVTTERQGKKHPQPYTRDEIARMLAAIQPEHRRIATLYLHTGLRRGEMMKLRWGDIDFEARTLTVRAPKNDDDRTIPLSKAAFSILQERHLEWEIERGSSVVDLRVFGDAGDIRKVLVRAAVRAGIEDGRRHRLQHRLRDTFATTLLDAGVALDRVQVILGHRDIVMTRRYAETRPEALREAISATFDR